MTLENAPTILTVPEMATVLRIGRNTAYRMVRDGEVPSIRFGNQIRIYKDDLLKYIQDKSIVN